MRSSPCIVSGIFDALSSNALSVSSDVQDASAAPSGEVSAFETRRRLLNVKFQKARPRGARTEVPSLLTNSATSATTQKGVTERSTVKMSEVLCDLVVPHSAYHTLLATRNGTGYPTKQNCEEEKLVAALHYVVLVFPV